MEMFKILDLYTFIACVHNSPVIQNTFLILNLKNYADMLNNIAISQSEF